MNKLVMVVLMVCFALTGCSDSGGGSKPNPCAGPVPCLAVSWGSQCAVFLDEYGDPIVLLLSDGEIMAVAGLFEIEGELYNVALGGPVINCYDANIDDGAVDYDLDGDIDYWFTSASGHVRVCATTLRIYDIVVEGEAYYDVYATFDSMASLSASNHLSTDTPISAENVEKTKILIKLIEQLMEE
ncbi:MAG: hypothetical protein ABIN18_04990 [Pseudomonadota bacterium]